MSAFEIEADSEQSQASEGNVIAFRPRRPEPRALDSERIPVDMQRFPVDIRGNVTFGRLMSGLATVGLTVRVDARSGRVVISDADWE